MVFASSSESASGFSQNSILPALAAAIAIGVCNALGTAMSTMSMSLRLDNLLPIRSGFSPAPLAGEACSLDWLRPQTTFRFSE